MVRADRSSSDIIAAAQRIADDVLFPAAIETDAAEAVPVRLLDTLAESGLYGLTGPGSAGGLGADPHTVWTVVEALSSGCLSTAFVWAQHLGVVRAAASSDNAAVRAIVPSLCNGSLRAGVALAGALAGRPALRATADGDGWVLEGTAPFVSGWNRVDLLHTAAATEDGTLVWALVEAQESGTLESRRLDLMALNATDTVKLIFRNHPVPREQVTGIAPAQHGPTAPEVLRNHASFALGVTARCCRLMGPSPLDRDLAQVRSELDQLDPSRIEAARGVSGELALRAAAALMVTTGSRSLLRAEQAQRLAREALFVLVYALRPGSRDAVFAALKAT